ncbi:DUF6314 family protein [Streptomyces sp. NBC_00344]|uniref:DUF6314 family protein n=1 Tax=Streptomyces sp. NBC_00344 TaxID=2975720 RepID=UPI002E1CA7F6
MYPVPDVLAYLAGAWRVERTVRDLSGESDGCFTGRTDFEPLDGGGLLHHESGTFVWQGVARPAGRILRFLPAQPGEDGGTGTSQVQFADGRFFHGLDLRSGHHIADHPCGADLYRGEFEAWGPDGWRSIWRVGGPAKQLLLTTEYTRER